MRARMGGGKTAIAGLAFAVLMLAVAGAAYLLLIRDAESEPEMVLECIQGRCVERPLDEVAAEFISLSPEEEVEQFGRRPPTFRNVAAEAGVAFEHLRDDDFFNLGGGAAAADFNGDGW